jgi:hypothetical protein
VLRPFNEILFLCGARLALLLLVVVVVLFVDVSTFYVFVLYFCQGVYVRA